MFRVLFIVCFILYAFFHQGFYNVSDWLVPAVFLFSASLIYFIYVWIRNEAWSPFDFVLFTLPLFYGAALLFEVESVDRTIKELIKVTMYGCFYFLLHSIKREKKGSHLLIKGFIALSYTILISTYSVVFQLFSVPHFWLELNRQVSGLGVRLGGFLGYPNAFAIVIVSFLLFHLLQSTQCQTWKSRAIHIFPLIPYAVLLLLTESRGAWIVMSICWMIGIFLLNIKSQVQYLLLSLGTAIGTNFVYFEAGRLIEGSLILVVLIILLSGLLVWSSQWMDLISIKWNKLFIFPAVICMIFFLVVLDVIYHGMIYRLLPLPLQSRLTMDAGTLSDRFLYVKDAWNAVEQFFWTGAGGEAWKSLMYQTQTSPYISHELHNFLMDIWVEIGIFGFIAVCVFLFLAVGKMFRSRSLFLPPFLAILFHSMIDFSISYGFIVFLLFYYYVLSPDELNAKVIDLHLPKLGWFMIKMVILILLTIMIVISCRLAMAETAFQQNDGVRAIELNPYNMNYRLNEAVEHPETAISLIEGGLPYEPNHSFAIYQLAVLYGKEEKTQKAMNFYERAIELDRYDAYKYEGYLEYLIRIKEINSAERVFRQYEALTETSYETVNQRNFHITDKAKETMRTLNNR